MFFGVLNIELGDRIEASWFESSFIIWSVIWEWSTSLKAKFSFKSTWILFCVSLYYSWIFACVSLISFICRFFEFFIYFSSLVSKLMTAGAGFSSFSALSFFFEACALDEISLGLFFV